MCIETSSALAMSGDRLRRRLGLTDAVVIGLSAMIGSGVFVAFGPAAAAAGPGLLMGLVLAAFVAFCNATAVAQLAAIYPRSGGTYEYGRVRLGDWWGFAAGWAFVVGKIASCATMAGAFAAYVAPGERWFQRLVALTAVVALTILNTRGITRTAALARVLVALTLIALMVLIVMIGFGDGSGSGDGWSGSFGSTRPGVHGVLQSAGLLFFAFAGYARVATLGEEVRDPARVIPRAIGVSLLIAVVLYAAVAWVVLAALGPEALASSVAPLADAAGATGVAWLPTVATVGAAVASLGALLALIAGVSRTAFAMARNGDLPGPLAVVHRRYKVPHRAELVVAALVGVLVLTADLRGTIGLSSFGVLLYYAIANVAAFTQPVGQRRSPRMLQVIGLVGCLGLAVTLPWPSVLAGAGALVSGLVVRWLVVRHRVQVDL